MHFLTDNAKWLKDIRAIIVYIVTSSMCSCNEIMSPDSQTHVQRTGYSITEIVYLSIS